MQFMNPSQAAYARQAPSWTSCIIAILRIRTDYITPYLPPGCLAGLAGLVHDPALQFHQSKLLLTHGNIPPGRRCNSPDEDIITPYISTMSPAAEESPSRSSGGLSGVLSKARRNHDRKNKKNGDASSFVSGTSDNGSSHGIRASIEGAIDKLKKHDEGDDEGKDEEHDSNGIKKLLPTRIASKRRRKKQEKEDEQRAIEEAARGRSVAERGTLENDTSSTHDLSGDGSSLITVDSDTES